MGSLIKQDDRRFVLLTISFTDDYDAFLAYHVRVLVEKFLHQN